MKKIVFLTTFVLVLVLGFLYMNQSMLIADDRDGKKN